MQLVSAQEITVSTSIEEKNENNDLYNLTGVEFKPEFPGGINAFYQFIGSNYNVPSVEGYPGGKIFVSFVIEKDGSVAEIKVLRDVGFGSGEEAVRVLNKCPKWKPATQNGKTVRCSYQLPISTQAYVYTFKEVNQLPSYEGGMKELYKFIFENFNKPHANNLKNGNILVSFIVEIDGTLSNIIVNKSLGFNTKEETIRVLKMTSKWIPAKKGDKSVRCEFGIPITFN